MHQYSSDNKLAIRRNVRRNAAGIAISFFSCAVLSYLYPATMCAGTVTGVPLPIEKTAPERAKNAGEIVIDLGGEVTVPAEAETKDEQQIKEAGSAKVTSDRRMGHVGIEVSCVMRNASVTVVNIATGQIVKEQGGVSGRTLDLDVSDLSRGDYLVSVEGELHRYTCRFSRG